MAVFKKTKNDDVQLMKQAVDYAMMYAKTEKESAEFALLRIDLEALEPENFVDARFGIDWPDYAMENMTKKEVIDLCAAQGRKAILLEEKIGDFLNFKSKP